jgi:SAM-dependent methyltransferase
MLFPPSGRSQGVLGKQSVPRLSTQPVSSLAEYLAFRAAEAGTYRSRRELERGLIPNKDTFTVKGYCYPCRRRVKLAVDFQYASWEGGRRIPNWRERLLCPHCGLNNRMRAAIQLAHQCFDLDGGSRLYLTEATTPLYRWFAGHHPNVVGSERLGDRVPLGAVNEAGVRNEDVTRLTFGEGEVGLIASFDVFEHVPDYRRALEECHRVLRPGGGFLFTVPFRRDSERNVVRAVLHPDGRIEHLLPPQYHGDPLDPEGCLAYYEFGWEILDQLREIGFARADAHLYWSPQLGYLGEEQIAFIALKGD